jgi:hypothetical protein
VDDPNDLYDTTFRRFTLQSPFLRGNTQRAIDLLSDERFVELDANLHYFERRYGAILAVRDERRDAMASVRGTISSDGGLVLRLYLFTEGRS